MDTRNPEEKVLLPKKSTSTQPIQIPDRQAFFQGMYVGSPRSEPNIPALLQKRKNYADTRRPKHSLFSDGKRKQAKESVKIENENSNSITPTKFT